MLSWRLEVDLGCMGCNNDHVGGVDLEEHMLKRSDGVCVGFWRRSVDASCVVRSPSILDCI
jgi:hypothetical protein